jgi:large subunit ribosomal protein L15
MKLSFLKPAEGSTKTNKRLGRGHGSGGGGTAGKGHKGAKSRSGNVAKKGFEGGQMPLQRRVPKFGFKNFNRVEYKGINLDALQLLIEKTNVKIIDLGVLQANGLTSKSDLVKILGRGELTSSVEVIVNAFSASAISAIENAGGKATVYKKVAAATSEVKAPVKVKAPKAVVATIAAPVAKSAPVVEAVVEAAPVVEVVVETAPVVEAVVETAPVVEAVVETAPVVEAVVEATPVVEAVVEDTPVVEEAKAEKKSAKVSKGDDLKLIEGIGPKIADLFINAGIDTFAKLADASVEQMKSILETGGPRYTIHDPSTWAEQAVLARDGKMSELKELQDRLNGGKA